MGPVQSSPVRLGSAGPERCRSRVSVRVPPLRASSRCALSYANPGLTSAVRSKRGRGTLESGTPSQSHSVRLSSTHTPLPTVRTMRTCPEPLHRTPVLDFTDASGWYRTGKHPWKGYGDLPTLTEACWSCFFGFIHWFLLFRCGNKDWRCVKKVRSDCSCWRKKNQFVSLFYALEGEVGVGKRQSWTLEEFICWH